MTLELSSTTWEQGTTVESTARLTNVSGRRRVIYATISGWWSYVYFDNDQREVYREFTGFVESQHGSMTRFVLENNEYIQPQRIIGTSAPVGTWDLQVSLSMGSSSLWGRFSSFITGGPRMISAGATISVSTAVTVIERQG